jgi:hypothetical protein
MREFVELAISLGNWNTYSKCSKKKEHVCMLFIDILLHEKMLSTKVRKYITHKTGDDLYVHLSAF